MDPFMGHEKFEVAKFGLKISSKLQPYYYELTSV